MATANKNLSDYDFDTIPDASGMRIGMVVSEWNFHITEKLMVGARETLIKHGASESDLKTMFVPGSFELPLGSKWMLEARDVDAVIAIGCVIQGETRHFDFVCNAVTNGIADLNLSHNKPVIFCVLTDNLEQQSIDRSGGKHGNKGVECAVAAIKMVHLKNSISKI